MAVAFPRSTRSLGADGFRLTLIGLAIAGALLIAWCIWFFATEITQYASSDQGRALDSDVVVAAFDKTDLPRIVRGQRARYFPDGGVAGHSLAVPMVVTEVHRAADGASGQVRLVTLLDRRSAAVALGDTSGRVEIETGVMSPAQMVLQGSGGAGQRANRQNRQ